MVAAVTLTAVYKSIIIILIVINITSNYAIVDFELAIAILAT